MNINWVYLLLVLSILAAACGSPEKRQIKKVDEAGNTDYKSVPVALPDFQSVNTRNVRVYNCGDSLQITAHVTPDSSWIFLPDTTVKTMPARSGSGSKFLSEDESYLFWSKEREALVQLPRGSLMKCKQMPREQVWEAARLRGVDFRAMGQEPGWYLEIIENKTVLYVGNYGEDTVRVSTPKPENRKIYRVETGNHKIKVEIIDELCMDSMNGMNFPNSVKITVDGKTYRGCGKPLS